MAHPDVIQALASRLLDLDDLGDLGELVIEFRANRNGGTHAAGCGSLRAQAAELRSVTLAEYRAAEPELHPCTRCGGGFPEITDDQARRAADLVASWKARLAEEHEKITAARLAAEERQRADAIDERAHEILLGLGWLRAKEREAAAKYSDQAVSATAPCRVCGASATITFVPRSATVTFACPADAEHGYRRFDEENEPVPVWVREEGDYIARGLVAPVLAGDDGSWERTYGTRAVDYQATAAALAAFDAANPEPMRLVPNVRCGFCGERMTPHPAVDRSYAPRIEARYVCQADHDDHRTRQRARHDVDETIDRLLVRALSQHPSWAGAPELEPSPELLARYAEFLAARAAVYDEHIGAASADGWLSKIRAELGEAIALVAAMREKGALRAANVAEPREWGPWSAIYVSPFSDLARALLTERIEITEKTITVITPFDDGTPLHRTLRMREICEELASMKQREQELTTELAELDAAGLAHPNVPRVSQFRNGLAGAGAHPVLPDQRKLATVPPGRPELTAMPFCSCRR